jgi:hypothetical protein
VEKQVALALDQIIRKIEPITRFNKDSFKSESDQVRVSTGKASWRFSPNIFIKSEEHTDRLPARATKTDNLEKLNEAAQHALKLAKEALPRRIEEWLRLNERTDRTLEPANCFDGPKSFGYEYECKNCEARGWVPCDNYGCHNGFVTCPECKNGQKPCRICNGKGELKCNGCNGNGKDSSGNVCRPCNGKKTVPCAEKERCDRCNGTGNISCPRCHGTSRTDCPRCKGKRYLHTLRIVECTVRDHNFNIDPKSIEPKGEKSEVVQQLRSRNLVKLRELASVTQMLPTVQNNDVVREYKSECIITEVRLQVAEKKLEIIGFGDKANIFDYKFIGSVLLDADLDTLKQAVANTPFRLWGNPVELLDATRQFLESEVNIAIDNPDWIQDKIVTATYLEQVKTFLPTALEKLYFANIGLALLITSLVPIAVFLVCHFAGIRELIGVWMYIGSAILAATTWILLERSSRKHLEIAFDEKLAEDKKLAEKLYGLLQTHRVLWKPRGLALALIIIILVVAAILPLPYS